jgi:hypothetical protein
VIKKLAAACLLAMLCCTSFAGADEGTYSFGYEMVKGGSGALTLRLTTNVASNGMWLGVTLYPPGVKDTTREANNRLYPIKQGRGITEVVIGPNFRNGTFEAAVWTNRLEKSSCLPADEVCKKLGYRMTGMTSYIWGYLVAP